MGLTSKRRYEAELQSLKNLSKEANLTDNPAADYQFLTHQYPISLDAHDLEEQVFDYFHTDKANLPPQETVYVFTFGTWDVWNLAAMPLEKGERLVDELTSLIFNQTELLYTQSLDIQSIAHSGYWGASIDPKASKKDKDRAIKEAAQRRRFNVVVPELFDMSLTPGWQFRDLPQPPHAPSEHMRNSALLTTRWNDRIREQMERWVALGTRAPENMPPDFIPAGPPLGTVEEPTDLYPRRVAYLAETATRMVEVLTEEDMQQAGESDRTGRGRAPPYQKLRFQNTRMACAARSSLLKKLDYGPHANEATRDRCMRPDNHLFYEPFTFNQRAVDEVGRMVAKGVNKNLFGKEEKEDDGKGK